MRITVHICSRDRHSELALLLQSLRTQYFTDFELDILILDDASGNPIHNAEFITKLIARLKMEGHRVMLMRRDHSFGVCNARQFLIDNDPFKNKHVARIDDDVILEPDYLHRLIEVMGHGYDIASGVTPLIGEPDFIRENRFIGKKINKARVSRGKLIEYNDDCGYAYDGEGVYPANEFRSCAMFKSKVLKKVKYPKNLSSVGFREEAFFSYRAQKAGFKIGVDVQAKAYHLQCSSGGVRDPDYNQKVQLDQATFEKFIKKCIKAKDLK